jgi:hypothetical protein
VQTPGRILTRRLDTGNNLEETGGKVKRALVAVVGAGGLITAGLTIAFDALMRRRGRKTARSAEADEVPVASVPAGPGERTVKLQAQNESPRSRAAVNANVNGNVNGSNGQSKGADATIVLPSGLYQPGEGRGSKR